MFIPISSREQPKWAQLEASALLPHQHWLVFGRSVLVYMAGVLLVVSFLLGMNMVGEQKGLVVYLALSLVSISVAWKTVVDKRLLIPLEKRDLPLEIFAVTAMLAGHLALATPVALSFAPILAIVGVITHWENMRQVAARFG